MRKRVAGCLQKLHVSMGRAYIAGMVGMLVLATGCPGDPPPDVDGGDGDVDAAGDGDVPAGGLNFEFVADPSLPSEPDGAFQVVITGARYQLGDVRAIGDAAPGDDRTSRSSFEIQLDEGATVRLPFPMAPQGIYSFLLADVITYELDGTVVVDTGADGGIEQVQFQIQDQPPDLELSVDLAGLVVGSQPVTCVIEIDLRALTRAVDWAAQEIEDDGDIEIESDDVDIGAVRAAAVTFSKR